MILPFFSSRWKRIQTWLVINMGEFISKQPSFSFTGSKLLCVDDDPDFCLYIQQLAHSLNIRVERAYSIEEAKQKIEEDSTYQAYIIDGHLPDGSGFEVVAWIREKKELEVPIAFISRIYQDAASFRMLKEILAVNYVLEKPLDPEQVKQLLIRLLQPTSTSIMDEPFSDELLADLKEKYRKSIFDKLERLEKMILAVQKEPSLLHLQTLRGEVHKIAGSSGSYGYLSVSEICKTLETDLIKQIDLAKQNRLDPEWALLLDDFFSQIKLHFQIESEESDLSWNRHFPSVFILDEDQNFLEPVTKDLHYNILVESDPKQALQALLAADFYPQILLVNAHYPIAHLTGYEFLTTFYRTNDEMTTTIGLVIDNQASDDHIKALQKGMTFILVKPFTLSVILPILDQIPFKAFSLNYKVLVVDDDPDICLYILQTLKYIGLDIQILTNLTDLKDKIESYQPNLILLDVNLANEKGEELLGQIRTQLHYRQLLLGMITPGQQEAPLIQKCYDANVSEIIFKPLESGVLQRKVAHLLKKHAQDNLKIIKDTSTNLEKSETFFHYLDLVQEQNQQDISPKILCVFELDDFLMISQQMGPQAEENLLIQINQQLEALLKKYEVASYIEAGKFALIFKGYDPYFVHLFMHSFLVDLHAHLQCTFHLKEDLHLNGAILLLTERESKTDLQQRVKQVLKLARQAKKKINLMLEPEFASTISKEVILLYDETCPLDSFRKLFKQHHFKVSEYAKIEDSLWQEWQAFYPLLILAGTCIEAKWGGLLKKVTLQKQLKFPILYLPSCPTEDYLKNMLDAINYFEAPFSLMILVTKNPATGNELCH